MWEVLVIDYSAQAIPMILGVLLLKYVDKFAEKVSPAVVSIFLRSMIDLLIVAPIMILVLGPVSATLTNGVLAMCQGLMRFGWIAVGITEPALYGVNLRMKRPFITMMIGAFIGGCYYGLIKLAAPAFATPSLLTFAIFVPQGKSILLGLSAVLVSFAAAFILTWIVGFKDLPATKE